MDDLEQYKMSLIKVLEGIMEDILSLHGNYLARGISIGIKLSIEGIKRDIGEPMDYSSDLDMLIEKDKQ